MIRLTMSQVQELVKGAIAIYNDMHSNYDKNNIEKYETLKIMFGKTLAINKNLAAGHVLSFDDLEAKKPANKGIQATQFQSVIGRKLRAAKSAWEFLTDSDLQ